MMRPNIDDMQKAHLTRLTESEDLVKALTEESDSLERWQSTCHVYNGQIDEINRAVENNVRFRSSEKEKRALLEDLRSRTLKNKEETEKLRAVCNVLEERAKLAKDDMNKENELFARLDENVHKRTLQLIREGKGEL